MTFPNLPATCHCDGVKRQKQSPYKLPTDRHTAFAMTSCFYTCRSVLVIANPQQAFSAKPKCEPATSHICGVVEAIALQATLVFGLLRYARNDKSQDGRVVLKDSSP